MTINGPQAIAEGPALTNVDRLARMRGGRGVRGYHSGIRFKPYGVEEDLDMLVGVEIEIEIQDFMDKAQAVLERNGYDWQDLEDEVQEYEEVQNFVDDYAKAAMFVLDGPSGTYAHAERDGSVTRGFELVTQPTTVGIHAAKLKRFTEWAPQHFDMSTATGLHVHVSKELDGEIITPKQILRLHYLLNCRASYEAIATLAGRYGDMEYCRPLTEEIHLVAAKALPEWRCIEILQEVPFRNRYLFLNVTQDETIEFRLFAGTLNYNDLMTRIEFALAATRWTRSFDEYASVELGLDSFVQWLRSDDVQLRYGHEQKFVFNYFNQQG